MNSAISELPDWALVLGLIISLVPVGLAIVLGSYIVRAGFRLSHWRSVGTMLLLVALGAAMLLWPQPAVLQMMRGSRAGEYVPWVLSPLSPLEVFGRSGMQAALTIVLRVTFVGLLPLLGIPFLAMLVTKWLGDRLTDAELQPSVEGVRAWLRLPNLLWAAYVSIGLWLWQDMSPLSTMLTCVLALAAYPGIRWATLTTEQPASLSCEQPPVAGTQSAAGERDRVFRMIEEGKISANDGAQLLNALGSVSHVPEDRAVIVTVGHKLTVAGAAILLLAFFLPWFSVSFNGTAFRGGDIEHGWGWMILVLSAAAAALPFFNLQLDRRTQRTVQAGALAVAAVLLLYVATSSVRGISIGIPLALCGLIVEACGIMREFRPQTTPA